MAFRKAMEELEEMDPINEGSNTDDTHTDQTNQYDIYIECRLRLSTETFSLLYLQSVLRMRSDVRLMLFQDPWRFLSRFFLFFNDPPD
jgi:hypothetical protein